MKSQLPLRCGNGLSPTDPSLLASPLEFISEDHMRERQICTLIDRMASSASFDRPAAQSVLRFLNEELNVHMRDEAEDLFPLLVQRCPAEDEIGRTITRIRNDLDEATRLLPEVRATLAHCLDAGCDLSAENGEMLMRFVGHVRRHLAAEYAILLPIARARLTRTDLETLSQHMRSRRGIPPNDGEDGAE